MTKNGKPPLPGPVSLQPPAVPSAPAAPTAPLRAVRGPPETCCYAHDAAANQHDPDCLVGMIYRIDADALDAVFEGFSHVVQKGADALAEVIVASQSDPKRYPPAAVHAAISAFNVMRAKAVEAQGRIHDRESAR